MRKNLEYVSLQISLGRIPAAVADEIVDAGDGLSLKGKAVLLRSAAGLEKLLSTLEVNPHTAAIIVHAAKLVEAEKAAASAADDDRAEDASTESR